MQLFNASSLFNESSIKDILKVVDNPKMLKNRLIELKKMLLKVYKFKAYNVPHDFPKTSYIIATNHLTDSDAPLIMSFYYELMHQVIDRYPELFVFAKENCFNGVSIPKELMPILELEKVVAVDRTSVGGGVKAIKAAIKWYDKGKTPRHFLIFSQGTIYDINKERAEDIEQGAFWLSRLLGIPILPAFIEQAVEGVENRLVFGEPIIVPKECKNFDAYKQLWIKRVIQAQDELGTIIGKPARKAVLDEAHQTRKKSS